MMIFVCMESLLDVPNQQLKDNGWTVLQPNDLLKEDYDKLFIECAKIDPNIYMQEQSQNDQIKQKPNFDEFDCKTYYDDHECQCSKIFKST